MERENEGVCEEEGVKTGKLESIRSLSTKRVKRLPAGRGCTQLLPQCMARRSSGSRLPACPPAAAPPQVAAPSWVLKQQKCDGLLSHSSSLSYRNVVSADGKKAKQAAGRRTWDWGDSDGDRRTALKSACEVPGAGE